MTTKYEMIAVFMVIAVPEKSERCREELIGTNVQRRRGDVG